MGVNWQFLKSYVFDFAWGYTQYSGTLPEGDYHLDKTKQRIFITHDPNLEGHQQTKERWRQSVNLYMSDDFFGTMEKKLDGGNSIVMT